MPINSFLYPGPTNSNPYAVDNSCRFNDGDTAYMHKTPSSVGDLQKFTYSVWFKRGVLTGAEQYLLEYNEAGDNDDNFRITLSSSDTLFIQDTESNTSNLDLRTNMVFRDVSAWYNLIVAVDTTQGTAANRCKVYVNGTQITSWSTETYPSQNYNTNVNVANEKLIIGRRESISTPTSYFDGYMCEVVFLDGTQASNTDLGEFDEDSPTIWKPKDVSGLTFGTNGFYLDFEDSANLGNDKNGGTDFTEVNLAATDQSTDTCTNNFATMNSIENTAASTFSEGNLQVLTHSGNFSYNISTIGVPAGKWYCEIKCTAQSSDENKFKVGIAGKTTASTSDFLGEDTDTDDTIAYNGTDGDYQKAGTEVSYGDSYTTNDIIGIALDVDNSKLYFSKNGTFQNSGDPTSGATGTGAISTGSPSTGFWHFAVGDIDNDTTYTYQINFGNPVHSISSGNSDANGYGNFEYAPPSGYLALCTKNLGSDGG